jgi:DNA-binding CsgD family transcriptional regulator/tetratricopeptide (TPR) repeat protein
VHPLVGEAVYRDLGPGARETAHERAARILSDAGATEEQVAAHLLHSPTRGDRWVVETLRAAADRAASRYAPEAGVAYLSRALEEPPPPEDMVGLLLAFAQAYGQNNGQAAQRAVERAYELATDPAERAQIAVVLTSALVFLGSHGAATRFAQRAAVDIPPELVDTKRAMIAMGRLAGWMHMLPVRRWMTADLPPVEGDGPGSRMLAIEQAWELCIRGEDRSRALALVRSALDDTEWAEGEHDVFHDMAGIALMGMGEDTDAYWSAALDRAHARGEVLNVGIHLWHGVARWQWGELREARQSLLTARDQTEEWGSDQIGVPYCDAFLTMIDLDLDDVVSARKRVDAALERRSIGDPRRLLEESRAAVLLAEGRATEALVAIDDVLRDQEGLSNPAFYAGRALRADILLALGRHDDAAAELEHQVALARRWGAPATTARLLRQRGIARGGAEGEALVRESLAILDTDPARLERARTLAALADVASADERGELLSRALREAVACDAYGLVRRLRSALTEIGVTPPGTAETRPTLTRLERQCLALAGEGRDVPTIARELYLTPRTVESALASARERLDVPSVADTASGR